MSTEVRNKKLYKGSGLYIGRPGPYGNDWSHKPGTKAIHVVGSVKEAVFCFTDWLLNGEDDRACNYREALISGVFRDQTLICWCVNEHGRPDYPYHGCHGLILAAISNAMFPDPGLGGHDFPLVAKTWYEKLDAARDKYAPRCSYDECQVHLF